MYFVNMRDVMLKGGMSMNYEWLDEYLLLKLGVNKDFKEEWEWVGIC